MEMVLQGQRTYFTVNGNDFPFDSILLTYPNTLKGVKRFPNFLYHRNKRNLNNIKHTIEIVLLSSFFMFFSLNNPLHSSLRLCET